MGGWQGFRGLVVKTVAVTPSGALSPGPLSLSAIVAGATLGFIGGVYIAIGHTLFELPYIAVLWLGARWVRSYIERFERILATIAAIFIVYFAYLTAQVALAGFDVSSEGIKIISPLHAIAVGIALTAFNPYFLLWWVSVGYPLVTEASRNGGRGLVIMYVSHVWMDYVWLALLAATGGLVARLGIAYKALMALIAVMLVLFALDMIARSWAGRKIIPL